VDTVRVAGLIEALPMLSLSDLEQLTKAVQQATMAAKSANISHSDERPCCPRCKAEHPYCWGKVGKDQRWKCRACNKTYTNMTGTPLAYAKKRPELLAAADDMLSDSPRSCRKLGEHLGVNAMTVWRWRLKILRSVDGYGDKQLKDLVEADETFFRESRKGSREWADHMRGGGPEPARPRWRDFERHGAQLPRGLSRWQIPVLVLRDRHGKTCSTRLRTLKLESFEPILNGAMAQDAMLCTDGGAVYRRWAKLHGRALEQLNSKKGIRVRNGVFHIQNANAYHARLKEFMSQFRGPSVRHLPLYIGWMALRDGLKNRIINQNLLIARLIKQKRSVDATRKMSIIPYNIRDDAPF